MSSEEKQNMNVEQQQIGAYGTYHKMNQKDIPLLSEEKQMNNAEIPANHDRAQ